MIDAVEKSVAAIAALRQQHPRAHCITNHVAQHFTASVLLACGATPSMSCSLEEIEEFVGQADAVLINLGTMDAARRKATILAAKTAKKQNKPLVLDPVFVQASKSRLFLAQEILSNSPVIIRANLAEAEALFNQGSNRGGIKKFTRDHAACVVVTGKNDVVVTADNTIKISNGAEMMTRLTAMGCALTALIAALSAVENDPAIAATAGLLWFNIAGEIAAQTASGPGTFSPCFIDVLASMDDKSIIEKARVS